MTAGGQKRGCGARGEGFGVSVANTKIAGYFAGSIPPDKSLGSSENAFSNNKSSYFFTRAVFRGCTIEPSLLFLLARKQRIAQWWGKPLGPTSGRGINGAVRKKRRSA